MPDPTVKMQFFGDEKGAAAAIARLERKYANLENKVRQTNRTSRRGQSEFLRGAQRSITALGRLAIGYIGVSRAIQGVVSANKRVLSQIDELAGRLPEAKLKAQIQAGATPEQFRKVLPTIRRALLKTPVTDFAGGLDIQRQLVSSGFQAKDIQSGDAIRTVLALKAATNQFGRDVGDVSESVRSIAQFLKAQGVNQPTAKQIRRTGGALTQLFEGSDIQFKDLTDLAGQAAALKSKGVSENIQLAAFSALRDVKPAPEAATGLRQVVSRLQGASLSGAKVSALKSIGLKPEDVNLIGEDLPTALERLNKALANVDKQQRSNVLLTLFGEKGEAAGSALLGKTDVIRQRLKIMQGGAFERNVGIFQQSEFAARERSKLRKDFALEGAKQRGGNVTDADVQRWIDEIMAERQGKSIGAARRLELVLGRAQFWAEYNLGTGIEGVTPADYIRNMLLGGEFGAALKSKLAAFDEQRAWQKAEANPGKEIPVPGTNVTVSVLTSKPRGNNALQRHGLNQEDIQGAERAVKQNLGFDFKANPAQQPVNKQQGDDQLNELKGINDKLGVIADRLGVRLFNRNANGGN